MKLGGNVQTLVLKFCYHRLLIIWPLTHCMTLYHKHFMIKWPELTEKAKAMIYLVIKSIVKVELSQKYFLNKRGWVIKTFLNFCVRKKCPCSSNDIFRKYKFWTIYISGGIRKGDNNVDPFSLTRLPYEGLMELNYYWSLDFFFFISKNLLYTNKQIQ